MLADLSYTALTILGIGFLIFIHELGHFLAARAVGIRVEVFSIGFGPKILGFRRGATEYKLGLIPVGGYVKMAGEDPTRTAQASDEFAAKSVAARTLVISAGVIMNLLFALVAIPIAFAAGISIEVPRIGRVLVGTPAWEAGLREGDFVTHVDGRGILGFRDILHDVALARGPTELRIIRDGQPMVVRAHPRDDHGFGLPMIGIRASFEPWRFEANLAAIPGLRPPDLALRDQLLLQGVRGGERILAVDGYPTTTPFAEAELDLRRVDGLPFDLLVEARGSAPRPVRIQPVLDPDPPSPPLAIGVAAAGPRRVTGLRPDGPAERAGLRVGDLILAVEGQDLRRIRSFEEVAGEGRDPRRTLEGGLPEVPLSPGLDLRIRRGEEILELFVPAPQLADREEFLESLSLRLDALHLVPFPPTGSAGTAGLQAGDLLLDADGAVVADIQQLAARLQELRPASVALRLRRDGTELTLTVPVAPSPIFVCLPDPRRCVRPGGVVTELRRESWDAALAMGGAETIRTVERIAGTLRSLITGQVSHKHLGGIISIFDGAKQHARIGLTRGLLFLAVISLNLAFLNILPIPILDGGWLLFLILEKIRGRPVNERIVAVAQWAGLALVLGLMLLATWNDIARLVGWMT